MTNFHFWIPFSDQDLQIINQIEIMLAVAKHWWPIWKPTRANSVAISPTRRVWTVLSNTCLATLSEFWIFLSNQKEEFYLFNHKKWSKTRLSSIFYSAKTSNCTNIGCLSVLIILLYYLIVDWNAFAVHRTFSEFTQVTTIYTYP